MMREQQDQGTRFGIGLRRRSNNLSTGVRWPWILPKKNGGDDLEPDGLMCSQCGKARVGEGSPSPTPLKGLTGANFAKNGRQNLASQGFAGQNLENTGVMAIRAFAARTASALTMICL